MQLANIKPDDIVLCDVRGDRFYAVISEPGALESVPKGKVKILSLTSRPIPAYYVSGRQVVAHWRKSKKSKA